MMVWGRAAGLLLVGLAVAGGAQEVSDKALFEQAERQALELQQAGRWDEALAVCERFLAQRGGVEPYTRVMVVRANHVLNALRASGGDGPSRLQAHFQRIHREFESIPEYFALATAGLARGLLHDPDRARRDPGAAEALLVSALALVGERLPQDYYLGYNLYLLKVQALRAQNRLDEAAAELRAAAERSPVMLSDRGYLRLLVDLVRAREPERWVSAARTAFVLCEYREESLREAMEAVSLALRAGGEPTAALRFVQAQDKAAVANPLREVALYEVGERERLMAAAGQDATARVNVHLAGGEVAEALEVARRQLATWSGQDEDDLTAALRNIARTIRAHDLNLLRANAFLGFHTQGEGSDPLPAIAAELGLDAPAEHPR